MYCIVRVKHGTKRFQTLQGNGPPIWTLNTRVEMLHMNAILVDYGVYCLDHEHCTGHTF